MRLPEREAVARRHDELRTANAKALISNAEAYDKFKRAYNDSETIEEFKIKADLLGFTPVNARHWLFKYVSWKDAFIWKYNRDNTGYTGSKKAGIVLLICIGAIAFVPAVFFPVAIAIGWTIGFLSLMSLFCIVVTHFVNRALEFTDRGIYRNDNYTSMFNPYNSDVVYYWAANKSS